jgi:hypothetical protein
MLTLIKMKQTWQYLHLAAAAATAAAAAAAAADDDDIMTTILSVLVGGMRNIPIV